MTLAQMSKEVRERLRMSQEKLAQLVGTNQTEISFIERGFIPNDCEKILKIEQLFAAIQ